MALHQIAEVVGRQVQLVGKPRYGRKPRLCHFRRIEIANQQLLETLQYIVVDFFTGHELTVVETGAVIEQQFDVGSYDTFAMLVYGIKVSIKTGIGKESFKFKVIRV